MPAGMNRCCQIRHLAGIEDRFQRYRQLRLANAIVRQRQQTDHGATGSARRLRGNQPVSGMAECATREQLIA